MTNNTNTPALGKLEAVDLRTQWPNEEHDFTPWLAQNLDILYKAIGIKLDAASVEVEKDVGSFRADILCKDGGGRSVVIENQLEATDHAHLGQLLTYAAGLGAKTCVWIARKFEDEHRAALDNLNATTHEETRFFGLEIQLWKIGDSLPAPRLRVVVSPKNWSKHAAQGAKGSSIGTDAMRHRYWEKFREQGNLDQAQQRMSSQVLAVPLHAGDERVRKSWQIDIDKNEITARLYLLGEYATADFKALMEQKEAIEKDFGAPLEWIEGPYNACTIQKTKRANPSDESDWPNQHAWLKERGQAIDRVFRKRVSALPRVSNPAQ